MNPTIKWALYARKSNESEDRQIQSIDNQVSFLRELAKREGLNIAEIICEAKSAKAPDNRSGFQQLITLIEKGSIQGILCWKLDRLSRNPPDSARVQWLLQTDKIKCIKTSDRNYLPDDNALLFAVEQGMANQYIRDLAKNVKRGLYAKANKGWFPGVPPVGYLNTKWREKGKEEIIVDKERFPLVRKMWDLMLSGTYSPMEILRIATTEWKLDTPKRRVNGKMPIVPSYIYKLLTNIFYTGNFSYGGKIYEGKHHPMITMEEFDKVQMLLGKKAQPRPIIHDFPFTGIMKCASCGASITASEKKKLVKTTGELKTYTYYHCTRRVGIDECKAPPVPLKELEEQILEKLQKNTIGPEFYELGLEVLKSNKDQSAEEHQAIYDKQQNSVNELQTKMDKLLGFLLNETISEEQYNKQKKEIEKRIAVEKGKLGQISSLLKNYDKLIENAFHFCRTAIYALQNGDAQVRRSILAHLGSNQRLNQKNLCVDVFGWFLALKNGEERLMSEIGRFELEKDSDSNAKKTIGEFSPLMCGQEEFVRIANPAIFDCVSDTIKKVRKEISQAPIAIIPDLSSWTKNQSSHQSHQRNSYNAHAPPE